MGYLFRTYECDSGGEAIEPHRFELMLKSDEHPSFCPVCGASVEGASPVPGTKNVGKSDINKSVDIVYRSLEESSAERAEMTGNSNFKITNMKDNLREGDVAAVPLNNSVTQFMGDAGSLGVKYGWGGGASGGAAPSPGNPSFNQKALPVKADPGLQGFTGPGHQSLSAIQGELGRNHVGTKAAMVHAGRMNKEAPSV